MIVEVAYIMSNNSELIICLALIAAYTVRSLARIFMSNRKGKEGA